MDRASSIYSQPSIIPGDVQEESHQKSDSVHSEISPLNTPHASVDSLPISPLISPVDTHFPTQIPEPRSQPKCQIPRRKLPETHGESIADPVDHKELPSPDKKEETKWDDYSGEPSATGKPSVVRPGTTPLEMQYPQLKERTRQILAGLRERDNAKIESLDKLPPPMDTSSLDNPIQREPWKGASGRTTLVDPVRNTPAARLQPLRIHPGHISRQTVVQHSAHSNGVNKMSDASPSQSPAVPSPVTVTAVASQESIRPTVPLKLGISSPRVRSPAAVENLAALQSPFQSPRFPVDQSMHEVITPTTAIRQDSPTLNAEDSMTSRTPTSPTPQHQMVSPIDTTQVPEPYSTQIPKESASRFSWTTYATTVNESPTSTANPNLDNSSIPPMPPIVVRKRPVSSTPNPGLFSNINANMSNTSVVSRKPVAAERTRAASIMTTASLGKSLPQCPPEIEAIDKIATLEARMDDLARRKQNLGKIIKEITDRLRRNSISYDGRKRREVEKMITNLKLELAEVGQEEHEVGIRLHRAQKRKDRAENYEPTGLWIKRVTS
jgi:hypothetical protein